MRQFGPFGRIDMAWHGMVLFGSERGNRIRGSVAQLVEQRTENPRVGGSIPSRTTIFGERM